LTWRAIDSQHMIREGFHKYFETVYGAATNARSIRFFGPHACGGCERG
jgi:hypothetical protein